VIIVGDTQTRDPRDESGAERRDRNLGGLLQELRVAGLGVQVSFDRDQAADGADGFQVPQAS